MNTERFDAWLQYLAERDALYWGVFVFVLAVWTVWYYYLQERRRANFYALLATAAVWYGSLAYSAYLFCRGVR